MPAWASRSPHGICRNNGHIATNCHRCPSERTIIGSSVKPGASLDEVAVSPDIMIEPIKLHRAPFTRCELQRGRTGLRTHAVGMPICPRPRKSVVSAFPGNDTNSCVGAKLPKKSYMGRPARFAPGHRIRS